MHQFAHLQGNITLKHFNQPILFTFVLVLFLTLSLSLSSYADVIGVLFDDGSE